MSKVYTGASTSIDGYVSGPDFSGFDKLFAWYERVTWRSRSRRVR